MSSMTLKQYLKMVGVGDSVSAMAERVRVTPTTLYNWFDDNRQHLDMVIQINYGIEFQDIVVKLEEYEAMFFSDYEKQLIRRGGSFTFYFDTTDRDKTLMMAARVKDLCKAEYRNCSINRDHRKMPISVTVYHNEILNRREFRTEQERDAYCEVLKTEGATIINTSRGRSTWDPRGYFSVRWDYEGPLTVVPPRMNEKVYLQLNGGSDE